MNGIIITADAAKLVDGNKEETPVPASEQKWKIEDDARTLLAAAAIYKDGDRLKKALKLIEEQKEIVDSVAEADEDYLKAIGVK
jgi:hypothetical protein